MGAHEEARRRFGLQWPTFGREGLLGEIESRLTARAPLVGLQGAPGVGKTHLLRALAARYETRSDGRAILVDLRDAADFDSARAILGAALDAPSAGDLGGVLHARGEGLLLLDHGENVQPELEVALVEWIRQAPQTRIVVGSRMRPKVEGVHLVKVAPLPFDGPGAAANELLAFHMERFGCGPSAMTEALAARVGGLPLALGLVASQAATLGTRAVLHALADDEDHEELTRAIDCSWRALDDRSQETLVRLAAFRGPCTLDAIRRVCGRDAPKVLPGLIHASLVEVEFESGDAPTYSLVPSVASFARKQLPHVYSQARSQHGAHYTDLAQELAEEVAAGAEHRARRLVAARSNLQHAFVFALDERKSDAALVLALALARPRYGRLPTDGCMDVLTRALALEGGRTDLRARVALVRARTTTRLGRFDEGERIYRALLADFDDAWTQGRAWSGLGALHMAQWNIADAEDACERALTLHRKAGDALGEGWTGLTLSGVQAARADYDGALDRIVQSIDIARRLKADDALVSCLMNASLLYLNRSQTQPARHCLEEAKDIEERFSNGLGHPWIAYALALVELLDGHHARGRELLERAVQATYASGETRLRASALCGLAELARAEDRFEDAFSLIAEAERFVHKTTPVALRVRSVRAALLAEGGRCAEAHRLSSAVRNDIHPDWPARDLSCLDLEEARVLLACAHHGGKGEEEARKQRAQALVSAAEATVARWPESVSTLSLRLFRLEQARAGKSPTSPILLDEEDKVIVWHGAPIDFSRRPVLWRLFLALCEHPEGMDADMLVARVWPDERMSTTSAKNRLHVAISSVRKLTAPGLVERLEGAYRLSLPVERRRRATG